MNLVLDRPRPQAPDLEGGGGRHAVAPPALDPDYSYRAVANLARRNGPPRLGRLVAGAPPAPSAVGMPTDAA